MNTPLKNEVWYLDRNGKIDKLSSDQILEGLLAGEIKVIHRISRDKNSWKAICNEKLFENLIEKATEFFNQESRKYGEKAKIESITKDQTGFHNLGDISSKIDEQLDHAQQLQELSVKLNTLRNLSAEIASKRKHVVDLSKMKEKINRDELHPDDRNEYIGLPTFSDKIKSFFNTKDRNTKVHLALVILVGLFAFIFYNKYQEYQFQKEREKVQAELKSAATAQALGQYDRALQIYSEVHNYSTLTVDELLGMADAYVQADKIHESKSLLNELIHRNPQGLQRAKTENLLGIAALKTNNADLAEKYFTESISQQALFSSLYNLAILNIQKDDYLGAELLLLKALEIEDSVRGAVLVTLFNVAWNIEKKSELPDSKQSSPQFPRLNKVAALALKENSQPNAWSSELYAIESMAHSLTQNVSGLINSAQSWMELNEALLPKKLKRFDIDLKGTSWDKIYALCAEVYKSPNASPLRGLFFAPCAAKQKGPLAAIAYAQYALKLRPELSSLRGYLGHLIFLSGNALGAKQILKEGDVTDSKIGRSTIHKICQSEQSPKRCLAIFGVADAL